MTKTEVINYFGGIAKTARALRIDENSVRRWKEKLPDSVQYRVELSSNGALLSDESLLMSHKNAMNEWIGSAFLAALSNES